MYGNNALGGVVNVITSDIAGVVPDRVEMFAGVQTESAHPGASGTLRSTIPFGDRWVVSLRGGGRTAGDVRIPTDPTAGRRLENTSQRTLDGSAGIGYIGESVAGGLSVRGYGFRYGLPFPPGAPDVVQVEGRLASVTGRMEAGLPSTIFPSLRLTGSLHDYHHDELEAGAVEMAFGLKTGTAELLLRQGSFGPFKSGAWGASTLIRDYVATGNDQLAPPADSRGVGVYGFQEGPLWEGGPSLEIGGRFDWFGIASRDDPSFGRGVRRTFTAFSGSSGLSIPLVAGVRLGVSVARSFRAPTVEELFSSAPHAGTAAFEVGDPDLVSERATGLDGVLRVQRPAWNAELSLFRNTVRDFVHFESRGDTAVAGSTWPLLAYVQNDARLHGFEASVEWLLSPRWVASGRADFVDGERLDGIPLPYMPPPRLGGALRYEAGALSFGGGVRHGFRQERVGLKYEIPCDAYTLFDLDAGIRIRSTGATHSITLRAQNLTDAHYRDAASRIKDFAPSPGRNISLLYRVYF
jgi:iron complex outermembrane recepter protein